MTPSKLTIIFAGEDITAELLDGSSAVVRVRAMPVRHLGRVLQLAEHEAELLEYVCCTPSVVTPPEGEAPAIESEVPNLGWARVPAGWADNLTDKSHTELYEAAKRLNFSRAATWAERQIAAKKFKGDLDYKTDQALMPYVERIVGLLAPLLKSSASPAAPSTKS